MTILEKPARTGSGRGFPLRDRWEERRRCQVRWNPVAGFRLSATDAAITGINATTPIPGIGHITAVTILAEIVDHKRFANAEKLVSYAGLSPKHHNSGDTVRMGGITKRGSVWLRKAMVEAAHVAIRHDARIGAIYQRLAVRIGPMKARVAIARRMLEWVWEMLDSDTEYRT